MNIVRLTKAKRVSAAILSLFVAIGLAACGNKETSNSQAGQSNNIIQTTMAEIPGTTQETTKEKVDYSAYDEFIKKVTNGLTNGFTTKEMESLDLADVFYTSRTIKYKAGYMFKDLDENGIDELILGVNGEDGYYTIYDIFTLDNGQMKQVVKGAERSSYYLCTNGMLKCIGSSGANYTSYEYYEYSGTTVTMKECVFTDVKMPGYKYFYSTIRPYDEYATPMRDEDAEVLKYSYKDEKLTFTLFVR